MIRRWLIRGLALTLLTLCGVAWVGSYWRFAEWFHFDGHYLTKLDLTSGRAEILGGNAAYPKIWAWQVRPYYADERTPITLFINLYRPRYHFLGFIWDGDFKTPSYHHMWVLFIPLWFPTFLCLLLLWFVWRKTRAKPVGGAFPVEVAKG